MSLVHINFSTDVAIDPFACHAATLALQQQVLPYFKGGKMFSLLIRAVCKERYTACGFFANTPFDIHGGLSRFQGLPSCVNLNEDPR
jgi:hypothetical protein